MEIIKNTEPIDAQQLEFLQKGIEAIVASLDDDSRPMLTPDQIMMLYTTVFNICCKHYDFSKQLYDNYRDVYVKYISATVLPCLLELNGPPLLIELVRRWENHKSLVKALSCVFSYLNRYFTRMKNLPTLQEVGVAYFRDMVYRQVAQKARNVVFYLIDQEREGHPIDRDLVKNIVGILIEMGMGNLDIYKSDLEQPLLEQTAWYYHCKASVWILENSSMNYLVKVEECLRLEKERVAHYLHPISETQLLQEVQRTFTSVCSNEILERLFARHVRT